MASDDRPNHLRSLQADIEISSRKLLGGWGAARAVLISVPFLLYTAFKVVVAFQRSIVDGIVALETVGIVLLSLFLLYFTSGLLVVMPAWRRVRRLSRNFPEMRVYVARNVTQSSSGIAILAPELVGTPRREYYGVVVGPQGFTLWDGNSPPLQRASVAWPQLVPGEVIRLKYFGKSFWVANFRGIESGAFNLSLSVNPFKLGRFSRVEASNFVSYVNRFIEAEGSAARRGDI